MEVGVGSCECIAHRGQKRALESLELGLQSFASNPPQVPGIGS